MILTIVSYDKERNTCLAKTESGLTINFDPFVSCAFPLSDDEYENGKGYELVGKKVKIGRHLVTGIVPHEGEMTFLD